MYCFCGLPVFLLPCVEKPTLSPCKRLLTNCRSVSNTCVATAQDQQHNEPLHIEPPKGSQEEECIVLILLTCSQKSDLHRMLIPLHSDGRLWCLRGTPVVHIRVPAWISNHVKVWCVFCSWLWRTCGNAHTVPPPLTLLHEKQQLQCSRTSLTTTLSTR